MNSQKALGIPVLLNPSTVMNIPQKNTSREYETWAITFMHPGFVISTSTRYV